MAKLISKTIPIKELTTNDIDEMFKVFFKYYEKISQDVFKSDLNKKDDVILLLDKSSKEIKGFSTLVEFSFDLEGKKIKGVFSGDTIIEKDFWGGSTLQTAFTKYMLIKKLKNPFSPLYWFLISKGYKTYLLLTNNFKEHYPRFDKKTPPHIKKIMDGFALNLYPDNYNAQTGLIEFLSIHDHLKQNVAPITEDMTQSNPQIRYFSEVNKNWQKGDELVCIANFDLFVPLWFSLKTLRKKLLKNKFSFFFNLKKQENT
jgi:hypothetical protein